MQDLIPNISVTLSDQLTPRASARGVTWSDIRAVVGTTPGICLSCISVNIGDSYVNAPIFLPG